MLRKFLQLTPNSIRSTYTNMSPSSTTGLLKLNHTCLRVKDPKKSLDFYTNKLGLELLVHQKVAQYKFDLYFLGYPDGTESSSDAFAREGVLELIHNYGTEDDPEFQYNNGNVEPHRGFGHTCISVDNIEVASERLLADGVTFQKKLTDGRQKDIAFALDPDGYWVELIENGINKTEGKTDLSTYKFNHTMLRVKDAEKSLKFYREVLGMKLLSTREHAGAKFTLYFLGYVHDDSFVENSLTRDEQAKLESVLELTWNWGTEKEPDFKYHNGNDKPQGYAHIGLSMEDPQAFCDDIEAKFGDEIHWGLKFNQGNTKGIGFIRDPDNYNIEILPPYPKF